MNYLVKVWKTYKEYKKWKKFLHVPSGAMLSETYAKYPKTSTFGGKLVLNIGCGRCTYPAVNVLNTDVIKHDGVDMELDLSKTPFPFADNSFDMIIANHVIEHVPNWFECFKELARIIKPNGRIEIWVPPVSSDSSFTYRDHCNRIGLNSFCGISSFSRAGTNLSAASEYGSENFGDVKRLAIVEHMLRPVFKWWTILAPEWLLEFYATHLRNVISEEGFTFTKV